MQINGINYSWTQPVCDECWHIQHPFTKGPYRLNESEAEVCCTCGKLTLAGIYTRIDPSTVLYPTPEDEDD